MRPHSLHSNQILHGGQPDKRKFFLGGRYSSGPDQKCLWHECWPGICLR